MSQKKQIGAFLKILLVLKKKIDRTSPLLVFYFFLPPSSKANGIAVVVDRQFCVKYQMDINPTSQPVLLNIYR